jgi:hypothetical protein
MPYLIFQTEQDAIERADEEGKEIGYTYWTEGTGTRWLTKPVPTADGEWALDVSEYVLDEIEGASVVDSYPIPDTIEDNI